MAELQPIIVFHGRHFVRHLEICNHISVKLLLLMFAVITHNSVKKRRGWVTVNYMFHVRHFVRHLGICNPICVKLLQIMSGVIPRNLKKTTSLSQTVFLASTTRHTRRQTHRHTDTNDDSIRWNAMRCISPNEKSWQSFVAWNISTRLSMPLVKFNLKYKFECSQVVFC